MRRGKVGVSVLNLLSLIFLLFLFTYLFSRIASVTFLVFCDVLMYCNGKTLCTFINLVNNTKPALILIDLVIDHLRHEWKEIQSI